MHKEQAKKQYTSPKLHTFGDVRDLTRQNNQNDITDVPEGSQAQVGYSPAAS